MPSAFLSHSSDDKALATRIAKDLHAQGVKVWFDTWSMKPGDSLRRKIEDGIEGADFFFVLLTPSSVKSPWVQEEIDGAFMEKIKGRLTLVPLVGAVTEDEVPALLRPILWVSMANHDEAIRRLSNLCHGVDETPPVGNPPAWKELTVSIGLTQGAAALAALLCRNSENGYRHDPMVRGVEAAEALHLSSDDFVDAVSELEDAFLIEVRRGMRGVNNIEHVWPVPQLFFECDREVMGWETEEDARALAVEILNGDRKASMDDYCRVMGWAPRRLNPALIWLDEHGYIRASKTMGTRPYAFIFFHPTDRLRRFAKGSI